ncbi:MAG: TLC domain-containing protein [Bacteroidota bacterium]
MTYLRNEKNNPFTASGFHLFLRKNVPIILLGIVFYVIAFLFFNRQTVVVVPPSRQLAWASRLVSSLHAVIAFTSALLFLTHTITSKAWDTLMNASRAYVLYDIGLMLLYPATSSSIQLDVSHHMILFFIMLFTFRHARYIAMGLLCEITQIPFYISWYLLKWDMDSTMLFKIFAFLTLLICFIFRVCLFSYIIYRLIRDYVYDKELITIPEILTFVPIACMNYYWFYLLVQKAIDSF